MTWTVLRRHIFTSDNQHTGFVEPDNKSTLMAKAVEALLWFGQWHELPLSSHWQRDVRKREGKRNNAEGEPREN